MNRLHLAWYHSVTWLPYCTQILHPTTACALPALFCYSPYDNKKENGSIMVFEWGQPLI